MHLYAEEACRILADRGIMPCEEAKRRYLETSGRPFREQLKLLNVPEELIEEISREFEERKIPILERAQPAPLVYQRINELRRRGLKTALSTNNECHLIKRVEWARQLFDIILCHDPVRGLGKGLPHLKQLEEMGYSRCEIIFIGDSEYDLEVYRPYGVRAIRTKGLWRADDSAVDEVLSIASARC